MTELPRTTPQTIKVLTALLDDPTRAHYGFELCSAAGLKSGTLYPILARLEAAGLLTSGWEADDVERAGPRRRYYRFSADGAQNARQVLAEHSLRAPRPATTLRPAFGGAQ